MWVKTFISLIGLSLDPEAKARASGRPTGSGRETSEIFPVSERHTSDSKRTKYALCPENKSDTTTLILSFFLIKVDWQRNPSTMLCHGLCHDRDIAMVMLRSWPRQSPRQCHGHYRSKASEYGSGFRDFCETCHKYSSCEWTLLKRFSRSEVI